MQIIRYAGQDGAQVGVQSGGTVVPLPVPAIADLLALPRADLRELLAETASQDSPSQAGAGQDSPSQDGAGQDSASQDAGRLRLLPPVDGLTEVWASGVTYQRSSAARQQESQVADVYARVYDAIRPELFFKSPAWRVCGPGEPIGIRPDSAVSVPEPELALVCNSRAEIVGVTICNDVSSRSIEGENPLYLPQAKIYAGACALGPGIVPAWELPDLRALEITATVRRGAATAWHGQTSTAQLHRSLTDLVAYLFSSASFPHGAVLSTGTGLVPELDFTLERGDEVDISITGIGRLVNIVRSATTEAFDWLTPAPGRRPGPWPQATRGDRA